jgi:hypothetical protein
MNFSFYKDSMIIKVCSPKNIIMDEILILIIKALIKSNYNLYYVK